MTIFENKQQQAHLSIRHLCEYANIRAGRSNPLLIFQVFEYILRYSSRQRKQHKCEYFLE